MCINVGVIKDVVGVIKDIVGVIIRMRVIPIIYGGGKCTTLNLNTCKYLK